MTKATVDQKSQTSFQLGGGIAAKLSTMSGDGSAKASVDKSASGGEKGNSTITSSYHKNNISVTFASSAIHWEFSSDEKLTIRIR